MQEGLVAASEIIPDVLKMMVDGPAPDDKIREAIHTIARKTHLAATGASKDFIYELARTSVSYLVGSGAVHDIEEWKTPEKYNWAIDQIVKALED